MIRQKKFFQRMMGSFLFLFLCLAPWQAFSKDFPTKPITIYCGMEPGATVDLTARALAEEAQKILGVPEPSTIYWSMPARTQGFYLTVLQE